MFAPLTPSLNFICHDNLESENKTMDSIVAYRQDRLKVPRPDAYHKRKNWLFVGSQLAGERAAVLMSLIESAKLNGHDPWAYLKDVFERLPTLKNRDLAQLLPHNWRRPINLVEPTAITTRASVATA